MVGALVSTSPRTLGALCSSLLVLEAATTNFKQGYFLTSPKAGNLHVILAAVKRENRGVFLLLFKEAKG